jgi:ClpX C4-type zinc finger
MSNTTLQEVSQFGLQVLSDLNRRGLYEQTILTGSDYYQKIKDDDDIAKKSILLVYMQTAINSYLSSQTSVEKVEIKSVHCSFCGQSPPKVHLGAGPNVFICNECVNIFSKTFNK